MALSPYVVNFLVLAAIPFALAAYGGHLAGSVLDNPKKKRRALWVVWSLAGLGVIFAALQQVQAYDSDKKHDAAQEKIQTKLDDTATKLEESARSQENMKGQLTSLALVMNKLVTSLPRSGSIGQETIKAWASALSMAFTQAAKSSPIQSQISPSVQQPTPSSTSAPPPTDRLKRMVDSSAAMFRQFDSFTTDEHGRLLRDHYPKLAAVRDNKTETDKENARFQAATENMLRDRNKQFGRLRAQALIYRTRLLDRLPPQPTDDAVTGILDDGNYNDGSANIVANYLQKLASQLPDK